MTTFIVLAVYILGVYTAYFQLQKWANREVRGAEEYQMLFMLSLISWFIYPIYGLVTIYKKCEED